MGKCLQSGLGKRYDENRKWQCDGWDVKTGSFGRNNVESPKTNFSDRRGAFKGIAQRLKR